MATALFCIGQVVLANDALTVTPVNLPQGGEAVVEVACSFEKSFKGYEMDIELSDGLTLTLDAEGKPMAEVAFGGTDHSVTTSQVGEGKYRFVCVSMSNKLLPTTGALLRVHVACPDGVAVGTAYTGRLTNMEFTTADMKATSIGDVTFSVIVAEPADTRVVLDENATTLPTAASGVDVRVKRKIKGGVWNTLVLPFSMTADQVVEAFGTDAELATFTAWESEEDKEGNIAGISVSFTPTTEIEANVPCLIRTSTDVDEFNTDGVDIAPESEPSVQVGKKKAERGYLTGTYVVTNVPEECLFLSNGNFWYSTGNTKIKGFRAYFEFADILSAYYSSDSANVRVAIADNIATSISNAVNDHASDVGTYDLQGRRTPLTTAGLYIVNGKKIIITK